MRKTIISAKKGHFEALNGIEIITIDRVETVNAMCKYIGEIKEFVDSYVKKRYGDNIDIIWNASACQLAEEISNANRLLF